MDSLPDATPIDSLPTFAEAGTRLVCADMDGTLLDPEGNIPDELWGLVRRMRERGITFVPASGRQYWTLLDMFTDIADGLTVIAENGALVMRDGREVSSTTLEHAVVRACILGTRDQVAYGHDCGLVLCGKKSAYLERGDERFARRALRYYHRTEKVRDGIDLMGRIERGDLDDEIVKVALFDFEDASVPGDATLGRFAADHQYVVSGRNWVDLMPAGVDKGVAVRALQRDLGIGREQTVVFGDFPNDLGMVGAASESFAMANGHPDVIAAARHIAPPNSQAGVIQVLRALLR